MKENGNFSLEEAKTIMKCILSGLIEMHARNIMHRDLKPENILFRSAGSSECVIADFGLSEHINKDAFLFTKCGTPGYEAP
jgi:calcium-dependent protein kinase